MANLIRRKLRVSYKDEEREVIHMQYMTWPDHGAPDESDNKIIAKLLE